MKAKSLYPRLIVWMLGMALAFTAYGEPVTLRTVSTFAGSDAGAQVYVDLLHAWEEKTGNQADDFSAVSDEAWKMAVLNDFAAGNEPDVFFYFAATADSKPLLNKVVPIQEINEAYPNLHLTQSEGLREDDGLIYAIDVRPFWEGLFVNIDLFEKFNLELPTDSQKFETAVAVFKENDIVPLAISLTDIPHYIVEFAILSSGSVSDYQARPLTEDDIPQSWFEGMKLIRHLYQIGAFPENVNATSEDLTTSFFINKKAAMLLDGSWRANAVPEANWDSTLVLPFPVYSDKADKTAIIGGTSMGFYVSRRAWEDETKRDAAVSLLYHLTKDESKAKFGFNFGGSMLKSALALTDAAAKNGSLAFPIGDVMNLDARNYWFDQIPAIADGTADIYQVLIETMNRGAFEK